MIPNELLLVLILTPPTIWLCACAGKVFFLPDRCFRFTCWRRRQSGSCLCSRHSVRMGGAL
jgi:hypothetical protein